MRVHLPPFLSFGLCPGSLKPPQLCGTFFVKGTLQVQQRAAAVWAAEPALVSGDLYTDDDPAKSLRYPSDFAVFKPRADLLLVGHAHAPGGEPTSSLQVGFSVGRFAKFLTVTGERTQPFTSMPLGYEFAYGGPGFERNPIGQGYNRGSAHNLFDPRQPEAHEPAGFGPIPPAWPQRRTLLGSYRGNYVKERWPWFPSDFDWGYFNAAPSEQQLDGYLGGDENITLENLHPEHRLLRSKLPSVRVRCFLEDRTASGDRRFREVRMRLDTLWIDTDSTKLVLVWRGLADVRTPKMREIDDVLVVTEPLAEQPRLAAEYQAALSQSRTTVRSPSPPTAPAQGEGTFEQEFADLDDRMVKLEQTLARTEQELAALGHHAPTSIGTAAAPKAPPFPPAQSTAEATAALATTLAEMQQAAPAMADRLGSIDLNEFARAEQELQDLKREIAELDAEFSLAIRWTRDRVQAAAAAKESLSELDFAGIDLSDLDLSGVDFSRSRLPGTNLRGAKLVCAKLAETDLTAANLEQADLTGASLDGADLTQAVLTGAKVTGLSLNRATLAGLDLAGANLTGSVGKEVNFSKANLAGAILIGVVMPAADFRECNLAEAVMTAAELSTARFQGVNAKAINLSGANLKGLQADEGADFSGGQFVGTDAAKATFDTSNLDGADFRRANLTAAQLEGASLRRANFDRANLSGAMLDDGAMQQAVLTNANLVRASLEGADLTGASLQGANLFEAGFWLAVVERAEFGGANRKGTLLE